MNQKPLRTLIIWTIWAAMSITTYAMLYQGSDVWTFVMADTSHITWIILGLFGLGVAGSFLLTLMITFETMTAYHIEEKAVGGGLKAIDPKRYRRRVGRFFSSLKTTIECNGDPEVESMLNVELSTYQRMSHSTEVIGNLLITLGLIGTVMGLTLTLTGLTGSLEALGEDQEMLLSGLRQAMAGMGTAFYTTLLGAVLGGILLRVFAQITDHGYDALFDKVVHTCLVHCSADLRSSAERDLKFLSAEIEMLGEQIAHLKPMLEAAQTAMAMFRKESAALRAETKEENHVLLENIHMRRMNAIKLRQEIQQLRSLNRPLWMRILNAFGIHKVP